MLGSSAGSGASQRGLWPLAPAPAPPAPHLSAAEGFSRYGVYSLFPGGTAAAGVYSHTSAAIGRFATSQPAFQTHKVSDSLFSSAGYTFGAPTPPPGSPYSPIPVTQLELLAKGFSSSNLVLQPTHSIGDKVGEELKLCDWLKKPDDCGCSPKACTLRAPGETGCSRTNPLTWSGVAVKREPPPTPCLQVAEVHTTSAEAEPHVKVEAASPVLKHDQIAIPQAIANGNIPVGIAVARQRPQPEVTPASSVNSSGLLTTINTTQVKEVSRVTDVAADSTGMAATTPTVGGAIGGVSLEDRLATWPVGGTPTSTLTAPTLWQYPTTTAPMPMESMLPLQLPLPPPVGYQLVRDPTSGSFLLIPTTSIEQFHQAVVWPSYPQPSSHVLLPPLPPPPLAPLQLLSSSADYLATSTTLHQHTQTHSTRLVAVTTDTTKRKLPLPALIKIETTDCSTTAPTAIDHTKTLQTVTTMAAANAAPTAVLADPGVAPLVTTHVFYHQHHPANLILSQAQTTTETTTTTCRSQATSPVACLTPPPEMAAEPEADCAQTMVRLEEASPEEEVYREPSPPPKATTPPPEETPEEASLAPLTPPPLEPEPEPEPEPKPLEEIAEEKPVQVPDLSGLELLSNSIAEFEKMSTSQVKVEEEAAALPPEPPPSNDEVVDGIAGISLKDDAAANISDDLGGLGLLCALAEQRFMEEVGEAKKNGIKRESAAEERRKDRKRCKRTADKPAKKLNGSKPLKEEKPFDLKAKAEEKGRRNLNSDFGIAADKPKHKKNSECEDCHRTYKTRESEEEVKRFLASKSQPMCYKTWSSSFMNAVERDMRLRLADLQRMYREKQIELSKLTPKKDCTDCSKKKSRKKYNNNNNNNNASSPPLSDKAEFKYKSSPDLLKPPTFSPASRTTVYAENNNKIDLKRKLDSDHSDSSPEKMSSSKKRKVGRPKRLPSGSALRAATETIVAKKPRSKSTLVNYLLAAKSRLQMQNRNGHFGLPKYAEEATRSHSGKASKAGKAAQSRRAAVPEDVQYKNTSSCKIRPKLKAEPKLKTYEEEDDFTDGEWEVVKSPPERIPTPEPELEPEPELAPELPPKKELLKDSRCVLTAEHLAMERVRVLTSMGGLFYAGRLSAIQAPDVYGITLDGERGNRPHIMSREEILRDAIIEVAPTSTEELTPGTRLCAYWSQQYRCLYPGTVAEPGTPDPNLDSKFVSVEFDDGDSGRIAIEDIRLLTPDYPIIEYDPNPLLSLSKRRRRTSVNSATEEKRPTQPPLEAIEEDAPSKEVKPKVEKSDHKERKKAKKRHHKEKLKDASPTEKKKKKKHKCSDEKCRHKKHKKHRKHRKHHHLKESDDSGSKDSSTCTEDTKSDEPEEEEEIEEAVQAPVPQTEPEPEPEPEPEVEPETTEAITEETVKEELDAKKKPKKGRERQESVESHSKMAAFLPARKLWGWFGKGYKRPGAKGRARKQFYRSIQRGKEMITVGDCAVFLSTGRPDRPYIGRIESMWESWGTNMVVRVKWFYHPEETIGGPTELKYPGALFESPHVDENDVQTISHKCEVLPLKDYTTKLGPEPQRYETIYDNNDIYYLAGYYDPTTTTLTMQPNIPLKN